MCNYIYTHEIFTFKYGVIIWAINHLLIGMHITAESMALLLHSLLMMGKPHVSGTVCYGSGSKPCTPGEHKNSW